MEHPKGAAMKHPLEVQYGLSAFELLDALNKRFRPGSFLDVFW
jgi:hypothetical protein